MSEKRLFVFLICLVCLPCVRNGAASLPIVPGHDVEVYADGLYLPNKLAFGAYGELFVGAGANSGNVSIYHVSPGGGPGSVSPYGQPVWDPDPVAYDATGAISGIPGAVLTGGGVWNPAHITAIRPNGTAQQLWPPPPVAFTNPSDMVFDSSGRLLFVDQSDQAVYQTTGGNPLWLFSIPGTEPAMIALNAQDHIFVPYMVGTELTIGQWMPDGTPLGPFVQGLSISPQNPAAQPLGFGPGGSWGNDLYAVIGPQLYRFDALGNPTIVGTGFFDNGYTDMAFGPDGSMYLAEWSGDKIIRITPVPAPGALVLGGIGVSLVGWLRKRRTL